MLSTNIKPVQAVCRIIMVVSVLGVSSVVTKLQAKTRPLTPIEKIVSQFYPTDSLDTDHELPGNRRFCFTVYDRLNDGTPSTIIAGYTDGTLGDMRALMIQPDKSYRVAAELTPDVYQFGGLGCSLDLVNLGGGNRKTVRLMLKGSHDALTGDWYFNWDGMRFHNLVPSAADDPPDTELNTTLVFDLDHDGIMEIIGFDEIPTNPFDNVSPTKAIYKLSGQSYVLDRKISYFQVFLARKGRAVVEDTLDLAAPPSGQYMLRVINGERGQALIKNEDEDGQRQERKGGEETNPGRDEHKEGVRGVSTRSEREDLGNEAEKCEGRVLSPAEAYLGKCLAEANDAEEKGHDRDTKVRNKVRTGAITINGMEVVSRQQLNDESEFISVVVSLKQHNDISVKLDGKPGSKIFVIIEPLWK